MGEELKTIKELADELGIEKKRVHYQVSKLDSNLIRKIDGTIYLNYAAVKVIKANIKNVHTGKLDTKGIENRQELNNALGREINQLINDKSVQIDYLKEQLKIKDNQLNVKDDQIKALGESQKQIQNLLDQQQRLALQDKQLLDEYKTEIKELKSLKSPIQNDSISEENGETPDKQESIVKETQSTTQSPKKWFQFWK